MKTTVNVMGIQAVNILERIAVTLKAVLRVGKENRSLQIIHGEKDKTEDTQIEVFTARDPVFPEERLVSEIPQPLWMNALLVDPKAMIDQGHKEGAAGLNYPYKKVNKNTKARKRTTESRGTHLTLVSAPQVKSAPSREIRDFRSSPSPPNLTGG
ncbi:hypothetical protein [Brevibacillus choshinensis]|uniref:Uncharacterized protein n=1 Tax=Brevibacillus choshinensis TaxID=54911 RepID=A0ABX7FNN3_BRECH|nr:hypothetical protein [Brevibacillus choshinensis]QRG67295.1 hypothetical protein JNE38_28275 [Brevibacillus choshinensis]